MTRYDAAGNGTALLAFAAKVPGHIMRWTSSRTPR